MVSAGVAERVFSAAGPENVVLEASVLDPLPSSFPLISRTSSFWLVEAVSQVVTSIPFLSTVTRSVSAMISSSLWVT